MKASSETDTDADDRGNDGVRIDATDLRAKSLGEGGNLGFTQKGRIEAALHGVRLNTDAIDNSGGVDMSDHEVNLKILLTGPVSRGELSTEARNDLLREMTDEVRDLVLANNDAHGRQLSRDEIRSERDIYPFARAIAFVEEQFGKDRDTLNLPDDAELKRRAAAGLGLTRPELAVLSAWVKMYVYTHLMAGTPRALTGYQQALFTYFPGPVRQRFADDIAGHQLADEIAMTVATTRIVADGGAALVPMMVEATGRSVFEIADAYLTAQTLARTDDVRSTLEELRASVRLRALSNAWVMVDMGAREVTRYWLSQHGRVPTDAEMAEMAEAVDKVYDRQASSVRAENRDLVSGLARSGVPEEVAELVLKAQYLNIALMVWAHGKRLRLTLEDAAVRQLAVGRASRLQEVIDDIGNRPATGRWDPIAMSILHNHFAELLRRLVRRTAVNGRAVSVDELEPLLAAGPLADVRRQVDQILHDGSPSVATLLVLEERVAGAISRMPAA